MGRSGKEKQEIKRKETEKGQQERKTGGQRRRHRGPK